MPVYGRLSRALPYMTDWRREVNSNCRYQFSKLSDESIMLEFAADSRIALIARRLQYCPRYCASPSVMSHK
jgi:hypothetical protein